MRQSTTLLRETIISITRREWIVSASFCKFVERVKDDLWNRRVPWHPGQRIQGYSIAAGRCFCCVVNLGNNLLKPQRCSSQKYFERINNILLTMPLFVISENRHKKIKQIFFIVCLEHIAVFKEPPKGWHIRIRNKIYHYHRPYCTCGSQLECFFAKSSVLNGTIIRSFLLRFFIFLGLPLSGNNTCIKQELMTSILPFIRGKPVSC